MTELCQLGVADIGAGYAARAFSPVELVGALVARSEALESALNVHTRTDHEAALVAARAAEQEMMAGRMRGPLHGVPVGVKDIIDVAGLPTTGHSRILAGAASATEDAHVVARLRGGGAIVMGKLSTHEFAIGGPSFDLPTPPARNPWNRDHHPGGSSSGSGAGLAAGFFPLALGTDTGGSIRHPASACGVVGLKPTYGLVSRRGVFPLSFSMDHVGPMARTVADAAAMLEVMAGHDPRDPGSAASGAARYSAQLGLGVQGLRVGFVRAFHETDLVADAEVAAGLEDVVATLERLGARVRTVQLPPLRDFVAVNRVIMHSEAFAIHAPWLRSRPGDYGKAARRRLMTGAFLAAGDYVQAQRRRLELMAAVNAVFRDVDVLVCASSLDPACRIDDLAEVERTYPRQARMPFNTTGNPALAMMAGFSSSGLPLSVQMVGPAFGDGMVLRVAAAYEQAAAWRGARPKLAA